MDRLQDKYSLTWGLGALMDPLRRLVADPDGYDQQERARTVARYIHESGLLCQQSQRFSTGEPGHDYHLQHEQFFTALRGLIRHLPSDAALREHLPRAIASAQGALDAIPVPAQSGIVEAGSPFSAYRRLRELCATDATTSLTWVDPYLDASVFHRYLAEVRESAVITLVTCEPRQTDRRGKRRWEEFLDVSGLFADERGPAAYRLLVHPSRHDRWLVFDDSRMYSLGGSVKDAAAKDDFTISLVDGNRENLAKVKTCLLESRELVGPGASVNPDREVP